MTTFLEEAALAERPLAAGTPVVMQADALAREYRVSRGLFARTASVKALNGVSFTLHAGRTLAVVGNQAAASRPWRACSR